MSTLWQGIRPRLSLMVIVQIIIGGYLIFLVAQGLYDVATLPQNLTIPADVQSIELLSSDAQPTSLNDLTGQHALVTFGYTRCADICPTTLADFRLVKHTLAEEGYPAMNFVFISVDGERDTPDELRRYISAFDESFIGLTTTDDSKLRPIADAFDVYYSRRDVENSAIGYVCDHTATIFLLNPDGDVIAQYPFGTTPRTMLDDLRVRL